MNVEVFTKVSGIWNVAMIVAGLALLVVSCLNIHWPTKATLILTGCWLLGIMSASYGVLTMAAAPLLLHRAEGFSNAIVFWFMAAVLIVIPTLKFRRYLRYYLKHGTL